MDWTGNSRSVYSMLGASNHSDTDRAVDDYYATEPKAVEMLLNKEQFSPIIWECAAGGGHISEVLKQHGYTVISTDIADRGYSDCKQLDFLNEDIGEFDGDIITNPPYSMALKFVERALEVVKPGHKVTMLLRLQFLESKSRYELFKIYPPKYVYVSVSRINCAKNGDFDNCQSAVAYAWFIWEKGFTGEPVIRWIE